MNIIGQTPGKNVMTLLYFAFSLCVLIFILSFINREIHVDDAWLGEQAYWLAKVGYVKSELLRGLLNYEDQQFVYHKLFIWLGALSIALFGFKLYILKSISLLFLVIFLLVLHSYTSKILKLERKVVLTLIIMTIINPVVFYFGFVYRPEVMLMAVGFITYVMLYFAHVDGNKWYAFFAGFFAGLSLLTHLNGLSIVITGFITFILFRQYQLCLFYSFASFFTCSFYFIDLHSFDAFNGYINQFNNDPALAENDYSGIWSYVINLLSEHKRFFRDPTTLFFSLLVVISVIFGYKGLERQKFLKVFTGILFVVFATLAQSKTTKYMLIYLPYLLLILGLSFQYVVLQKSDKVKYVVIAFILVYGLISLGYNIGSFSDNVNAIKMHREISSTHDLLNKKMVAPMQFIYEQFEDQNIQSVRVYKFLKDRGEFLENGSFHFFKTAEFFGNTAIVLIPESFGLLDIPIPNQVYEKDGKTYGNFKLVEIIDEEYFIYKSSD